MNKRSGIGKDPPANGFTGCVAIATLAIPEGKPLPCELVQVQAVQHHKLSQQTGVSNKVELTPGMPCRKNRIVCRLAGTGGRMPVHQEVGIGVV